MVKLRGLLRRGCRRQLVPCYLVLWWWALYCITILEWRKLLNVEVFGVEVRHPAPLFQRSSCGDLCAVGRLH